MVSMDPVNSKLNTISFFTKLDVAGDSIFCEMYFVLYSIAIYFV